MRRLRRNTCEALSLAPVERLLAFDWNATQWGEWFVSPSTDGLLLSPFACCSELLTLARWSAPPRLLGEEPLRRTNTSWRPLVSFETRFDAELVNA